MKKQTKIAVLMSVVALISLISTITISALAEDITASKEDVGEVIEPAPEPQAGFVGGIEEDKELSVSVDDYVFGEGKVLCVKVNNLDDVAYAVDLKVTYYSAEGTVLGEETQSYDQLVKGYEKNFVFVTDYDFADYYLETVKTVYNGDCWKTDFAVGFGGALRGYGDYYVNGEKTGADFLSPAYVGYNNGEETVIVNSVTMVIFDKNGEVYDVLERGGEVTFPVMSEGNYKHFPKYAFDVRDEAAQADHDSLSELSGFVAYNVITTEESYYWNLGN